MYAETQLVVPGAIPYINAVGRHVEIPTHDKWSQTMLGKAILSYMPQSSEIGDTLTAGVSQPIKQSAGTLQRMADELSGANEGEIQRF